MRTTHKLNLTRARVLILLSAVVVMAGLAFAFATFTPVAAARQSMAARLSASPAITNILSVAPKSILKAFGLKASMSAMNNNEAITISSFPPSGSTVEPGGIIAYNINITNGPAVSIPDAASDHTASVTVNIPAGTLFQSVNVGGNNGPTLFTCSPPAFNTLGPASFTCSSPIFVPNGNINVTLVVRVTNPYVVGGPINNSATYQDQDNDGTPNAPKVSNTVTHNVSTAAGPAADLSLKKFADKISVLAGANGPAGRLTYSLYVRNNGPNTANGVTVFDEVPANTQLAPGGAPAWNGTTGGNCSFFPGSGSKFFCYPTTTDATLPANGEAVITYTVKVPAHVAEGSIINNSALVASYKEWINSPAVNTSPDPTPTNNYATTSTRVKAIADLSVINADESAHTVCAGGEADFIFDIVNDGPSDAVNVVLRTLINPDPNTIVNSLLFVNLEEAPGFACNPELGTVGTMSCTAPTLAAGQKVRISIRVKVRPDFTGNITYVRHLISSDVFDPDLQEATDQKNVIQCPDVEVVSKSSNPSTVVAGDKLSYEITVRNNGPSDAKNVVFTDPIPAGTTFESVVATGVFAGRCNDTITCTPPNGIMPAGAVSVIRVTVKVDPSRMAPVVNTATINANQDTNPNNNSKQATSNVIKQTDISVKKSGPATVTAGNQYTYTVVVRNNGPSDAPVNTVTISDTLDSKLAYQVGFETGDGNFNCSNIGNAVTCVNDGVFHAGGVATLTFIFTVNNNVPQNTIIANTVTSSSPNDPNNANNTSTTSTAGQTSADLQLTKTATAGPVVAGSGTITYTIFIGNSGPSNANGVKVNDNIPANTTLTAGPTWTPGAGAPAGSCSVGAGGTITCQPSAVGGVLQNGQTATITYTVSVPASALNGTLVTNQAVIASTGANATPDPNPSNNTQDPTSTLITTSANLTISKTDTGAGLGPDPVIAGQTVTYRIRTANAGPSDAQNVVVTDQLDPNTTFESINITGAPGFTCVTPAVGQSGTLSCSRGVVPPGATNYDILVTVRVRPGTTGSVSNTSTAASATNDPSSPNTATETTNVNAQADVELVAKTDSPDPVIAGENLTYTITFRNNGPSAAQNVVISDAIPANTTFVAVNPPDGYLCTTPAVGSGGVVTCSPPDGELAAGAIADIKLTVKVSSNPSSLTISNTATISTTTTDPTPGNNSKTETTTVIRNSDLDIKKTGPATVTAGNTFTYTIVVRNDGPSDAPVDSATITDILDSNLTPTNATADGFFDCSIAANTVTCKNNSLFTVGGKATITITFTVKQGVPQNTIISNTATVSSAIDLNVGNNTSTTSTAGQTTADLQLAKTATPAAVTAGDPASEITYTINVLNSGPSVANGVVVSDFVPANTIVTAQPIFTNTGSPSIAMTCSPATAGAQFTCVLNPANPMPVGAAGRIVYKVRVAADIAVNTVITNGATIASTGATATPDANPANNKQDPTSTLVNTLANLSITKSDAPDPVVAGTNLTYTLTVANIGPSNAQNVVVTDNLPAGLTFLSSASSDPGFVCLNSNNSVVCNSATLAAGASATITIVALVNPTTPNGTVLINSATISSTTADPVGSNNTTGPITTTVNGVADVEVVSKVDSPDPVIAGQNLTYKITFKNNGPSAAQNVAINDTVPANTTFVAVNAPVGYACAAPVVGGTGLVSCSPPGGELAAGAIAEILLTVRVSTNPSSLTLSNTAAITTTTSDPTPGNNSKTETTTVNRNTDFDIKKSGPATVTAGNTYTYTIVVRNDGPSDAPVNSATITDILDSNLTPTNAIADGFFTCSIAANTVTCNNNSLFTVGGKATITITFSVKQGVPQNTIVSNTATVSSVNDPNTGNNTSTTATAGQTSADLQLTKTANPSSVTAGDPASEITYTIGVLNSGPSVANNVVVSDFVPANTIVTSQPVFANTGSPAIAMTCSPATAGAQFICVLNPSAPMPVGAAGVITYKVRVAANLAQNTLVTNQAQIDSTGGNATPDPNPSNNIQAPTSTLVNTSANLSITKTDSPDPVTAGNNLTYTLSVANAGPSDAQNVVVTDALPAGLTYISAASSDGGFVCLNSNNTVTCNKATLAAGASATITIVAKVNPEVPNGTVLTNSATISSTTADPVSSNNNTGPITTTVNGLADVEVVSKTDSPDPVIAGQNLTYKITFKNNGPSAAQNVAINDTVPANTTFVAVNAPVGYSCTTPAVGGTGSVSCSPPGGELAAGVIAEIKLTVKVSTNPSSLTLSNTASISTTTSDSTPGNNSKTETTTVIRNTDLDIKKTGPATVTAGNTYTYTIVVRNDGPSDAPINSATITDILDADLTPTNATADGFFTCSIAANTVTCNNNSLFTVGGKATITITFSVKQGVTQNTIIQNTATVSSVNDPNTGNNASTTTTAGQTSADLQLTKTANPSSVTAGDATSEITYTINVVNSGPSVANSVVVSDFVPANTIVSAQPTFTNTGAPVISMTCSAASAGAQFTCVLNPNAPMPVGSAGRITYKVRIPTDIGVNTVVTNGATIASTGLNSTPDPNPANNKQDPTSTLVNTSADLSITKSDAPDPVIAGANLTYTLTVANAGPSDAQNVVVKDALPAGLTFVSANSSDAGFVCLNSNNTVNCSKATLAAGASAIITIVAKVNASLPSGTTLTNSATISSTTADPVSSNNNTGPITTTVNTNAVFTISKSDNPDPVIAGTNLSYRVTLTNNGPSDAQSVVLKDTLPTGVDFVSLSATGVFSAAGACTHSAGVITCNATPGGVMPAGATANLNVVVKVKSSVPAGTVLTNTAVVTSPTSTQSAADRTATTTTTVRHQSDLSLVKEAPADAIAGTRIDYKLTIKNNGPSDVLGGIDKGTVTVVDELPAGVTPVDLTGSPNLVITGPGGFTCSFADGKITCVNAAGTPGNFPVGSVTTIIIKVNTPSNIPDGTNVVNCAEIVKPIVTDDPTAADETDPNGGNNRSCDSTVFRTSADLGIGKTATPINPVPGSNPPAVKAGENIRYSITFGNAGPSDAVNVKVTDNVPGNTSMVTTFPLTVLATGGVYIGPNAVKVACSYNTTTNVITCLPTGNTGLTPSVPNGVLPAGVQGILTYDVKVNPSVTGGTIIANAANITSAPDGSTPGTPDPNTGNNTSLSTSTPVVAASQLGVTKTIKSATFASAPPAAAGAVVPGTFLTYEITLKNNGPSDVSNVRLIDTLPSGLETPPGRVLGVKYISVTQTAGFGSTFTCAPPTGVNPQNNPNGNGGVFQCTAPSMAVTTEATEPKFEVVVFIDPATKAALVNKADINATTNNFNQPVSASATLTTPVGPTSDLVVTKTHTPDPVVAGTEFEYTVTLTNNGPSAAQMTTLVDTLPAFQALKSIQITQNPDSNGAPAFTCTPDADAGVDPRATTSKITCTAAELPPNKKQDGTVNPAGTVVFKIRVLQSALTPQPTPVVPSVAYQNCVTATSMSFDPTTVNVCDTVNVIFRADLSITKSDSPDPVIAGTNLTYTINATNGGPSAALNMRISDPIPAGTVFVSATAPGSTSLITPAVNANGTVTATWAGLTAPGVTRSMTIVVRVCPEVLCNTVLNNTATTTSDTPDPNPANNSATEPTTVRAQSDLTISKSGPAFAIFSTSANKSVVTYTLSFSNKGPSNAAGTKIVDVLPKGFVVDTNGLSSTVPGTTFDVIEAAGITTVTANLGVLGAANQCTTDRPTSGTVTIRAVVPIKHPVITVTNTATISTTNCLPDPNLTDNTSSWNTEIVAPGTDPTTAYPATTEVSDTQPGSILFFPIYTSDAVNPNSQNARINITNTSSTENVCVHLFAVDGSSCAVLDAFICLTPNQTTTFLASDFDPGNSGYLMAVAVECDTGLPRAFNCLIGDEYVKFSSGHQANLGAEAIQSVMMFPGGTDPNVTTTTLRFDGMNYNRLPRILAADNIQSTGDGNSTLMIINRVGGNFTTTGATIGNITGNLYDDAETGYSFTANLGVCQSRQILSNSFPRTFTPFSRAIPAGRSGWMKFWAVDDRALFGSMINFNGTANSSSSSFNQGHNLHKLTLTDAATIVVPVFIPSCSN